MAEVVQQQLEESVPELHDLLAKGLFSREELRYVSSSKEGKRRRKEKRGGDAYVCVYMCVCVCVYVCVCSEVHVSTITSQETKVECVSVLPLLLLGVIYVLAGNDT